MDVQVEAESIPDSIREDVATVGRIAAAESILKVVCKSTGLRFAAIARVSQSFWVACAVRDEIEFGLVPGGELPVKTTICDEIQDSHEAVVIDHVAEDQKFRDHHTPRIYGFQSYISVPIKRTSGEFFGTLCALDPLPAKLSDDRTIAMFEAFASLISLQIDAEEALQKSNQALLDERETSELREQFIAVIGHDLRNPLMAASASTEMLLRMTPTSRQLRMVEQIRLSTSRMAGLIDNLLDFARGRLGGGIGLERRLHTDLGRTFGSLVQELLAVHPKRRVDVDIAIDRPVFCDARKVSQIVSNLLANALVHGDQDKAVAFSASCTDDALLLSVRNSGKPITAAQQASMFRPFNRGRADGNGSGGLGLGLYIASRIAEAHGGRIAVISTSEATVFTATIPVSGG